CQLLMADRCAFLCTGLSPETSVQPPTLMRRFRMPQNQTIDLDNISMDELMQQYSAPASAEPGAVVRGTVIRIDRQQNVWIDFGAKNDGMLDSTSVEGRQWSIGDQANFMVGDSQDTGIVSLYGPETANAWLLLQEHARSGQPVDVTLG